MAIVKRAQVETIDQDERSHPRDFAGLTAELADANPVARRWAARDLSTFADAASPLVERLRQEHEPSVREAILLSLTQIGSPEAVGGMVECLHSEDAELRNKAIEAMKQLPDAVAPIMAGLLAHPDPDVRIFAVNVLESLRHGDVEKWLIGVIAKDEHVNVCATAVDLLAEVGTESAVAPLEHLKSRFPGEPYISFTVDLALKRIRVS
jgi:HEAT repeat protein